jgi:hypothetical protein
LVDGKYLGGAEVTIKDNMGKEVLDAATDGPLFFAKLPVGSYTVQATTMGQTLTRNVSIPPKGQAQIYLLGKTMSIIGPPASVLSAKLAGASSKSALFLVNLSTYGMIL